MTADKALHKFWQLYGAMKNKKKSKTIPDFQRDDNVWVRSDEEKGEALFARYLQQTNQDNEVERINLLNTLKMNFDGQGNDISLLSVLDSIYLVLRTQRQVQTVCARHISHSWMRLVLMN